MKKRQLMALALAAGLLLVPVAASADSHEMAPKPLTWISFVQSQVGKTNALTEHLKENGAKIYDGLVADGHVLTWGVALPVNHNAGDDWNVVEWVTFRDWAGVDAFMQAFMGMQMAKSPEQAMAEQEKWYSLIEPGSHRDEIWRHQYVSPGTGRPAYIDLSYFPVKPGQAGPLKELWMENAKPTLDGLQADGAIGGFGMARISVHDGITPPSVVTWTTLPNLAALDTTDAAFDAADKARGEEATKELMKSFMSKIELAGHHDRLLLVTHFGGGGGAAEGGE